VTRAEVDKIIERLKNGCIYHRFDEPGVYAEYVRVMVQYSFAIMNRAVNALIEEDSQRAPAISALIKAYRRLEEEYRTNQDIIRNEEYCDVCDDKGFVLITINKYDIPYQFVLYCPFCQIGRAHAYDGRQCKDHKSPYYVPPLTDYFDDEGIEALREENLKRRASNTKAERPTEKELQAIGKSIPDGWQYDVNGDLPF
jgi:hypothetical protein